MFKKYHSIENHYRDKFINQFLIDCPKLKDAEFIIQEKIHGANIQFIFEPNEEFKVGKRTSVILEDEKFYNIQSVIPDYKDLIESLQEDANEMECTINLYGELFGPGIQKGVDYGDKKQIRFFDMTINGVLQSQYLLYSYIDDEFIVPTIKKVNGLQEALDVNIEIPSLINPVDGNIMEGVVIKPYSMIYRNDHNEIFMIKKKNEKFIEKMTSKKERKPIKISEETFKLREEFSKYINKNRVDGIFSKHGEIDKPKDIGKYIGLVIKDAIEDFEKDFEEVKLLDKKDTKFIYNSAKDIVKILNGYL